MKIIQLLDLNAEFDSFFKEAIKLGFKMGRTTNPLFHLEHTRTHTSYGVSQYDKFNQQEFYRISNMSKVQLLEEISKWK